MASNHKRGQGSSWTVVYEQQQQFVMVTIHVQEEFFFHSRTVETIAAASVNTKICLCMD
jgi:hypothetical protein